MSAEPLSSSHVVPSTEIVPVNDSNPHPSSVSNFTEITTAPNQIVNKANSKPIPSDQSSEPKPSDNKKVNVQANGTNEHNEVEVLRNWIDSDLKFIEKTSNTINNYKDQIEEVSSKFKEIKETGSRDDFRALKKMVTKLKQQISSKNKDESTRSNAKVKLGNDNKSLDKMPKLYEEPLFECSPAFQDFQLLYNSLETELKLCLLCFSVFPEDAVIKKRLMVYWWIGEGFIPPIPVIGPAPKTETAEELGNEFFNELMVKGFIEPYYEKRSLEVHSCKMHPFVRSAVIMLAKKAKFFDFDEKGNVTGKFSNSLRACLAGEGLIEIQNLEPLHMVFNVNEPSVEFKLEWFLKMINVNVLYLGRWQASATHHIEVDDLKFLEGLMKMKHLRLFSLQGVSRITELPKSISRLGNLTILDLRACHSLEVLPDGIGSLKSLTHLDMSECYLLDQMPKGLASLSQLQVLKGFFVGKSKGKSSCTLDDLAKLRKLKKLSVYTGLKHFPAEADLFAFQHFEGLCKLTIAWGRGSLEDETDKSGKQAKDAGKSTAPNNTNQENKGCSQAKEDKTAEQAKDAGKSTAPDKMNPDNKGSSQAKEDKKAKQESGASKTRAADTLTEEKKGGITKKGDSTAAEATAASDKPTLFRPAIKRSHAFKHKAFKLPTLPSQLKKLDLQCYPMNISPSWLMPANLKGLEKLYIRGGKFSDLGQFQDKGGIVMPEQHKWNVEVLRLKYLNELEMDWRELRELFPKLIFLEKVKCPKLAFFPCDEKGVWINRAKK
ncbi:uncharacterized protein LOC132277520 [Cornus florida]|uniref:uncharacterized protein LOC132277520 n=1 Tax=Cornus florida TaxID=4283 RepID=UPI0028972C9F|nr:uncharacterized protein LOC132277520 [Cornus florida]